MTALAAVAAPASPTSAATVVVCARGVVHRYRNGRGVGPVDLDVRAGETVALMGRNGCGKTTLLRMLATAARPQRGAIAWFGEGPSTARRHVGLALDSALEDPGLTGRQATHFWCAQWIAGRAEVAARVTLALQRLGLADAADRPVGSYSFGMRRRLAIAAAVVHDPALLVLDEPSAGLDPEGTATVADLLAERARAGLVSVIASNDPALVETAAGRVVFLDEGRLIRDAPPLALVAELPPARIAEMVVAGGADLRALRALTGVSEVEAVDGTIVVHFTGDEAAAALVAAADAPGGRLRELRLRTPGLADCFRALTGRSLEDDG